MAELAKEKKIDVKVSTLAKPYHYVGAGLSNVYLVGVEYRVERESGLQSADIPCLPELLGALAKTLVEKKAALNADELRFLRKRLQIASKEFASYVGLTPEQYSRLENGAATITPMADRVVRLLYATLAKLPPDASAEVARTKWSAEMDHAERIIASQDANHNWIVKTKAA